MVPLRGNLDTRIRKLKTADLDGIVLALAGVRRLNLEDNITEILSTEISLPAIGQGALGIETRTGDQETERFLRFLNDPESSVAVSAERAFLKKLEGGCQVPIAAYGRTEGGLLRLDGLVGRTDGKKLIRHHLEGPAEEAETIGTRLAVDPPRKGSRRNPRRGVSSLQSKRSNMTAYPMREKPLTGKTILITRAREQSSEFAARLRERGADVVEFPTIEIVPPLRWKALDSAIARLNAYNWIVFTSVNGVSFFLQRLNEKRNKPGFPTSLKVCAIGPATARELKKNGIRVDYTPKEYIAEAILEGFEKMNVRGKRILLARVKKARDILPKGLKDHGGEGRCG